LNVSRKLLMETGLSASALSREVKLNEVLNDFNNACLDAGVDYALFGGTAINKLYLSEETRFSEDLDLHVFNSTKKKVESLLKELNGVLKGPTRIFKEFYRWGLTFEDEDLGGVESLNFDVGIGFKESPSEIVFRKSKSFLNDFGVPIASLRIPTYSAEAMVAMKCLALNSRAIGKDYYDLHHLLKTREINSSKALGEAYAFKDSLFDFVKISDGFYGEVLKRVQETDVKELRGCDAFIPIAYRPDWAALKNELVWLVKSKLC